MLVCDDFDEPIAMWIGRQQKQWRIWRLMIIASLFVLVNLQWATVLISPPPMSYSRSVGRRSRREPLATVGYAVSITACSGKLSARVFDAASVLRRSVQLNSWPVHNESSYAAEFYAFSHPSFDSCNEALSLAGWRVLPQGFIDVSSMDEPEGSSLKEGIGSNGCCGDKELMKLFAYTLDEAIAVHLDLDTLVVHPLDELFDVMHFDSVGDEGREARLALLRDGIVAPTYLNRRISGDPTGMTEVDNATERQHASAEEVMADIVVDAFFTKDYNMIRPGEQQKRVGVQGGFLVVRTSMSTYERIVDIVLSGEYYGGHDAKNTGWRKSGYGNHIWGSMTIQGLLAYYFDVEQLERSVELNRCRYNNIADNARVSTFSSNPKFPRGTLLPFVRNASNPRYDFHDTVCRDGRTSCGDTDCQRFPVSNARVLHYTYCKSPWSCNSCEYLETYKEPTCHAMTHEWFRVRGTLPGEGEAVRMEDVRGNDRGPVSYIRGDGEVEVRVGNCYKETLLGFCLDHGNYVPMTHRNLTSVTY